MTNALILVEHDGVVVRPSSLACVTLARQLNVTFSLLVIGYNVESIAASVQGMGATRVLIADDACLVEPLAERFAPVVVQAVRALAGDMLVASASTYAKDILPRAAALLDSPMLSEVVRVDRVDGRTRYVRPVNAGAELVTAELSSPIHVITIRASAFATPASCTTLSPIERLPIDGGQLPRSTRFVSRNRPVTARPGLSEARVVVCGGRPLQDAATFERLIGGLADALGGAVGATRAAVDLGLAPNMCQIGQTASTIAPELYLGIGVSGAIQHIAGIQDARVIVAINRDPEAPVFDVATYGLVGDLNVIVPELMAALRCRE